MHAALSIQDLKKTYANGHDALKGITLTVQQGDFFALLGRNGAGKSTVIGIISSLVKKDTGTVSVFDANIDMEFSMAKSYLGIVPQEFNFNVFETPDQIVTSQAGYYGLARKIAKERTQYYLNQLGLWGKRNQQSRALSSGMKRRLMIARALVHQPKLLILDEPTAGVDIEVRRSMWDYLTEINQQGTTIILTTHYLEEAENLCRNIAIIDKGRLLKNTSIKSLLSQLKKETYILNLAHELESIPDTLKRGSEQIWTLRNNSTLEVDVLQSNGISAVFKKLTECGIVVQNMKTKTNRLERLFLEIVEGELKC